MYSIPRITCIHIQQTHPEGHLKSERGRRVSPKTESCTTALILDVWILDVGWVGKGEGLGFWSCDLFVWSGQRVTLGLWVWVNGDGGGDGGERNLGLGWGFGF